MQGLKGVIGQWFKKWKFREQFAGIVSKDAGLDWGKR